MSLIYNLAKIKKDVCFLDSGKMSTLTEMLIMSTMFIGMNEIKESNWKKFYARLHMFEKVNGSLCLNKFFTSEEIKNHIGLGTNASLMSDAEFMKKMKRYLIEFENSCNEEEELSGKLNG